MLSYIQENYCFNMNIKKGLDNRFHTVYYIEFETGQFYVGKHTTKDIINDNYFCSGKAAITLKNNGIKYNRVILYYFDTADKAIEAETLILSNKKYFNDKNCLNCYPGSPPNTTGFIVISKENVFKVVHPNQVEFYINKGWQVGGVKRIYVYKNGVQTKILPEMLEEYLNNGWLAGNMRSKNCVFIEKNGIRKFIKKCFLEQYENDGWIKKHNVEDTKVLRKNGKIIKVKPENLEQKLSEGYYHSSTVDGLIYIRKNDEYKRVLPEVIDQYIECGWELGNNASGSIYINDGNVEKRIRRKDFNFYQDWHIGRLEKIYLNNGRIEKRVYRSDKNTIDELISQGFAQGKLVREKKIRMYRDGLRKVVPMSKVDEYKKSGWN